MRREGEAGPRSHGTLRMGKVWDGINQLVSFTLGKVHSVKMHCLGSGGLQGEKVPQSAGCAGREVCPGGKVWPGSLQHPSDS